jgi:hypothetical protein
LYVCVCARREGVEFSAFMQGEGFSIIPIKHDHQLAYACNVLNLGNGRIISVHPPSAREIVKHSAFKGDIQVKGPGFRCMMTAQGLGTMFRHTGFAGAVLHVCPVVVCAVCDNVMLHAVGIDL